HWYRPSTMWRWLDGSPSSRPRTTTETAKDATTAEDASQPADRPGHRRSVSSSTAAAASGSSGITVIRPMASPPQEAGVVHVGRVPLAVQGHDDREAHHHLGRGDGHGEEGDDLSGH